METLKHVAPLLVVIAAIGVVAVLIPIVSAMLRRRLIDKAIRLIEEENKDFDANALRCALEAERQRKHAEGTDDDRDDFGGPTLLAA